AGLPRHRGHFGGNQRAARAYGIGLLSAIPRPARWNFFAPHFEKPAHGGRGPVPHPLLRGAAIRRSTGAARRAQPDPRSLGALLAVRRDQHLAVLARRAAPGTGPARPSV